jgi:hypothetical protein
MKRIRSGHPASSSGVGFRAGRDGWSDAGHEFLADHAAGHLAPIMKARPPNLRLRRHAARVGLRRR